MAATAENPVGLSNAAAREALRTEALLGAVVVVVIVGVLAVIAGVSFALTASSDDRLQGLLVASIVNVAGLVLVPVVVQYVIPPIFERRQLRLIATGRSHLQGVSPFELARVSSLNVFLPLALGVPLVLLVVLLGDASALRKLAVGGRLGESALPWLWSCGLAGAVLMLFAFAYHRVPNCRRSVKYGCFLWGTQLVAGTIQFSSRQRVDDAIFYAVLGEIAQLTCFLVMRSRLRPEAPLDAADPSTARALKWRRRSMAYGPQPGAGQLIWLVIKAIPILGDVFWAARIYSKQRLARAPVLFLRSFSNPASPRLLSQIVAPAVSRSAVLAALVHPSQTSGTLNKLTHEGWLPLTLGVPNDLWQQWYLTQLRGALAVIFDASMLSESTRWELENAYRVLGRDRVAVLGQPGTAQLLPHHLVFEWDSTNTFSVRSSVERWIDDLLRLSFERSHLHAAGQDYPVGAS